MRERSKQLLSKSLGVISHVDHHTVRHFDAKLLDHLFCFLFVKREHRTKSVGTSVWDTKRVEHLVELAILAILPVDGVKDDIDPNQGTLGASFNAAAVPRALAVNKYVSPIILVAE